MTDATGDAAGPFAAGTIVSADYLPWARVLADSFAEHHDGARLAVLVLDDPAPELVRPTDSFDVIRPEALGVDPADLAWMSAIYDPFELSCALKPWLLELLLDGHDAALYLDSDILVCAPLTEIAARAAATGLLLTPHTLEPIPRDGLLPDEDLLLRMGQFNAGFLAVGQHGRPFLRWWSDHLRRDCVNWSPADAWRFVDQRWLDLAVNFFSFEVLRDRGANVAYFNLGTRTLEREGDAHLVDGEPLRFFHFSGFDPAVPEQVSKHQGPTPRVDATRLPALARLCADYAERLVAAGLEPGTRTSVERRLGERLALTLPVRRALRAALLAAEADASDWVPDPTAPEAVWEWLAAPVTASGLPRYLAGLRAAEPSLQAAFPHVPGPDEQRLLAWADQEGVGVGAVPAGLQVATRLRLDGARSFVALVDAGELAGDPALLAGLAARLGAADDVTLLVRASGLDAAALTELLEPLLASLGLDGPDAPDMLALSEPAGPAALAPHVHAVLTRGPVPVPLAHLPRAGGADELHALVRATSTGQTLQEATAA